MGLGIGLYVGRKHVVIATVEKTVKGYQLKNYAVESISQSDDDASLAENDKKISGVAVAIQGVLRKINLKRSFARLAISPFYVVTRYFIMPTLPAKEKDEAIRYEASRHTRLKLTESVFAYHEYPYVQNVSAVTANAVKRRQVQLTTMNARRAGVDPDAIEPDYVSFSRTAAYFGLDDFKKAQCFVWFDSDQSISLTLVSKGIVFLSHDFRLSGNAVSDQDKFHDELMGAARYLAESAGGFSIELFIVSGFGALEEWAETIQKFFNSAEVQILRHPLGDSAAPEDSGAIAIALGLALGDAGWESPIGNVSLLPPEERKLKPTVFYPILATAVGIVAAFFFVVHMLVLIPFQQTVIKKKTLAEEPLKMYGSGAGQSLSDLTAKRAALAPKVEVLEAFDQSRIPLTQLLQAAVKAMPESMWLRQLEISQLGKNSGGKGRFFSFLGYCYLGDTDREVKEINQWVQVMSNDPAFSNWFPHLALDEVKQERVLGRMATKFVVLAEKK